MSPQSLKRSALVLTVLNLKGGVGKTHSAWLLASVCEERGLRCLLIDTDPQGNLSNSFARDRGDSPGIERLLDPSAEADVLDLVRRTDYPHIDLVPSNPLLARFDLSDQRAWEASDLQYAFVDPVATLRGLYDLVIFDCPPRLSLVSYAALCASDGVIVPLEAADWGAQGIVQVTAAIDHVRERHNRNLRLLGYLVSRYKARRAYQQSYLAQLRSHFGKRTFDVTLPDLAAFERSVTDAVPITRHSPRSAAADHARRFFDETLARAANSTQAALEAATRTFASAPSLPLDASGSADPAHEGRQRLRGAFLIDLARIRPDPAQPRKAFDPQELENLVASVREYGVRQPIRVWYVAEDDVYQIIAGERRYRAATAAGLSAAPCIVEPTPSDRASLPRTDVLLEQISENWQRADLKPLELSDALAELRDALGVGPRELAKRLSKPESEVSRLLSLQKIEASLRQQIGGDERTSFTRRHLIAVAQLPATEQSAVVEAVRERSLTALETEKHVAGLRGAVEAKSIERRRGSVRRFVIGAATVEVRFRKREATDAETLDVLERACRMVRETGTKPDA